MKVSSSHVWVASSAVTHAQDVEDVSPRRWPSCWLPLVATAVLLPNAAVTTGLRIKHQHCFVVTAIPVTYRRRRQWQQQRHWHWRLLEALLETAGESEATATCIAFQVCLHVGKGLFCGRPKHFVCKLRRRWFPGAYAKGAVSQVHFLGTPLVAHRTWHVLLWWILSRCSSSSSSVAFPLLACWISTMLHSETLCPSDSDSRSAWRSASSAWRGPG